MAALEATNHKLSLKERLDATLRMWSMRQTDKQTADADKRWYGLANSQRQEKNVGPVHTEALSYENAYILMRLGFPSGLTRENALIWKHLGK